MARERVFIHAGVAYRLQNAKTPETRTKRIKAMIEMFERGEKFHD